MYDSETRTSYNNGLFKWIWSQNAYIDKYFRLADDIHKHNSKKNNDVFLLLDEIRKDRRRGATKKFVSISGTQTSHGQGNVPYQQA